MGDMDRSRQPRHTYCAAHYKETTRNGSHYLSDSHLKIVNTTITCIPNHQRDCTFPLCRPLSLSTTSYTAPASAQERVCGCILGCSGQIPWRERPKALRLGPSHTVLRCHSPRGSQERCGKQRHYAQTSSLASTLRLLDTGS